MRLLSTVLLFISMCTLLIYCSDTNAQLGLVQFQPESFEQANPALMGMAEAQQIQQQELQNQALAEQVELEKEQLAYEQQIEQANNSMKIMVFGTNKYGNPSTYLGCLNCVNSIQDSIFNSSGIYGSDYGNESIYNSHCIFGSARSNFSACNYNAKRPPLVIDSRGIFYGLLTLNSNMRNAIKDPRILYWLKNRVCIS